MSSFVLAERIRNRDRSWTNMMTLGLLDRPEVPPPIKIEHPEGFATAVDAFVDRYRDVSIDLVAGIESRGFIFGAAVAYGLRRQGVDV